MPCIVRGPDPEANDRSTTTTRSNDLPFATIHNTRMFYRLQGNPGRPVLVLSHSISTDHAMWDLQAGNLLPYFQILRYDTRGHGASDVTAGEYTIEILGQGCSRPGGRARNLRVCLLRPVAGWSDRPMDRSQCPRARHPSRASQHFTPVRAARQLGSQNRHSAQRRHAGGRRRGHAAILLTRYPGKTKSASRFDPLSIRGHRSRRLLGCCAALRDMNHTDVLGTDQGVLLS